MMPTLWLFDIEPHEQRYTIEWAEHLPKQLQNAMAQHKKAWRLEIVKGTATTGSTTPGAFLNFAETNAYKAEQVAAFSRLVHQGKVKDGDRVLFADAWHPGVIHLRYMADLLGSDFTIDVMWHAGSYDPHDFLGRNYKTQKWSFNFERALFEAADRNYFATKFHQQMFVEAIEPSNRSRPRVVGWPMEYLSPLIRPLAGSVKKDTILFPHRMAPEKMPRALEILRDYLPQYRIVFAQEQALTKQQYHAELARALVVFSASLQETLGIGTFEGLLAGAVPVVPNRLSYTEIYPGWTYPAEWSASERAVGENAKQIVGFIERAIRGYDPKALVGLSQTIKGNFFDGRRLYRYVLR